MDQFTQTLKRITDRKLFGEFTCTITVAQDSVSKHSFQVALCRKEQGQIS